LVDPEQVVGEEVSETDAKTHLERCVLDVLHKETLTKLFEALCHRTGRGGTAIIICNDKRVKPSLRGSYLDNGLFTKCFQRYGRSLYGNPLQFESLLRAFREHTDTDRWEKWLVERLARELGYANPPDDLVGLVGEPKDGAMVVSLNGTMLAASLKLRHGDYAPSVKRPDGKATGTRTGAVAGVMDLFCTMCDQDDDVPGLALVASDSGDIMVMLPTCAGIRVLYVRSQFHTQVKDIGASSLRQELFTGTGASDDSARSLLVLTQ